MKLGTLFSKGQISPYDLIVVKKARFDFRVLDIYKGEYRTWNEISCYLEMDATIIWRYVRDNGQKRFHILLT